VLRAEGVVEQLLELAGRRIPALLCWPRAWPLLVSPSACVSVATKEAGT
jgi:hypothetical protein